MAFRRFRLVSLMSLVAVLCLSDAIWAAKSELISETAANQQGLTRPWFTQTAVDTGIGRLADMVLFEGVLFVQTDKATVQAIDAETGKTLWSKRVGNPAYPSMRLGVNHDHLAIVNGSRLYVLNRHNSDLLLEKALTDVPGAGPAVSSKRVYVPMVSGKIVAYRLQLPADPMKEGSAKDKDKDKAAAAPTNDKANTATPAANPDKKNLQLDQASIPPMTCQSFGRVWVQPQIVFEDPKEERLVWPTERGFLNLARVDRKAEDALAMKYRLQADSGILAQPGYLPPNPEVVGDPGLVITGTKDGFVYAFRTNDGETSWRYSTAEPIASSPTPFADRVYVTTQLDNLFCLSLKTGNPMWVAPGIRQFVAASKSKVYVADNLGRLVVLDAAKGTPLGSIDTQGIAFKMRNTGTDRIYLATDTGLIQCLHEIEQTAPIPYAESRKAKEVEEQPAVKQTEGDHNAQPAPREHVAPKEPSAPKAHVAPKKAASKKKGKKQDEEGFEGGDANPFDAAEGGDKPAKGKKAAKNGKTGKAGKGKKKGDDLDTGF
jgi:outer membrane protein assembly factor BamB